MRKPDPSIQLGFHALLLGARNTVLRDALRETVAEVDPDQLAEELAVYAPASMRKVLAKAGIRDEEIFPIPVILTATPTLVGYYRLLLGVSQKQFYGSGSGMGPFKAMEERGVVGKRAAASLPEFCEVMGEALGELVIGIKPAVTPRDVEELPLLTLGAQFKGKNNNLIGQMAADEIFLAIKEVVEEYILKEEQTEIVVENSAGRKVRIVRAADPDVRIEELFEEDWRGRVAIEIKGGADMSNAHNRVGEAEKSHQKARLLGFRDYWTVLAKTGLDIAVLEAESPTTSDWFEVSEILARDGTDWLEFRRAVAGSVGIPA